jgi:hypothetical protein
VPKPIFTPRASAQADSPDRKQLDKKNVQQQYQRQFDEYVQQLRNSIEKNTDPKHETKQKRI